MRSVDIKNGRLRLCVCLAIVLACCSTAAGAAGPAAPDSNAVPLVSKTLEERLKKTISVEFRKTAIEDVLRIMADQADVDIVKSPKVTGEVTVTLTDVPLEEALTNILSVHGFVYVLSQNMIRVITNEEQVEKPEILQTRTFEIVYANVEEVVKALEKFKSSKGSVSHIAGTSHIIITDNEQKIREITNFIEKVDVMTPQKVDVMTPQVLVEARIYDITSTDNLDIGIQWQAGRNTTLPAEIGSNPTAGRTDPFIRSDFSSGTLGKTQTAKGQLRFGWLNSSIEDNCALGGSIVRLMLICCCLLNRRISGPSYWQTRESSYSTMKLQRLTSSRRSLTSS